MINGFLILENIKNKFKKYNKTFVGFFVKYEYFKCYALLNITIDDRITQIKKHRFDKGECCRSQRLL
ncbi:TPA_asm: hypothetical protein G0B27_08120 [Salmonella enterica subsp. indica]|uniref:Uncharacterized protein n=1 Tax=Salmonella enterica TaxID=28901 RepID=A0A702EDQ5_SALER|nr:hypothetical protein [Salmonella enterica subsp. indica]